MLYWETLYQSENDEINYADFAALALLSLCSFILRIGTEHNSGGFGYFVRRLDLVFMLIAWICFILFFFTLSVRYNFHAYRWRRRYTC